jgi:AcrR family transcriptional regulator
MASEQDTTRAKPRTRSAPVQARSRERIEAVLAKTEEMILEVGPEATSIPDIAAAVGVPRATIYQYFPDKYALFAHLAGLYFGRLAAHLTVAVEQVSSQAWQELVRVIVDATADYLNADRAAAILTLNGPFGSADRIAHEAKDLALQGLVQAHPAGQAYLSSRPVKPERVALVIKIAFACLRYGYQKEGRVSPAICDEAVLAATAYLEK